MIGSGVRAGGCLCGAVRYRVNGPLRDIRVCHVRIDDDLPAFAGDFGVAGDEAT